MKQASASAEIFPMRGFTGRGLLGRLCTNHRVKIWIYSATLHSVLWNGCRSRSYELQTYRSQPWALHSKCASLRLNQCDSVGHLRQEVIAEKFLKRNRPIPARIAALVTLCGFVSRLWGL